MRPDLINRLKEEWNNLDPVDPLRGLIADAIDALADHPAQGCEYCNNALYAGTKCKNCGRVTEQAAIKRDLTPEQPAQQEPVAWMLEWTFNGEERGYRLYDDETHCKFDAGQDGGVCRPLVYGDTAPPAQRKPLTDEEIESINVRLAGSRDLARLFARAIEAKLKEKNT